MELLLTRYALERLLHRLSVSPHRERFVLRGAMLLATWFDETSRLTETWHQRQQDNNAQRHTVGRHTSHVQCQPGSPFRELRVFRVSLLNSEA